ncbi:adhesin [Halobacillus sp. K22]|uniref:adhesin n=1 Tax=Halobacillus sp. K22 TaxID=3457431 RepID=UPI003FCDE6E5
MKITDEAKQALTTILGDNNAENIRIYAMSGGCCGPQIGLSLEEAQTTDSVQEVNGISLAIDQEIKDTVQGVTLDKDGEQLVMLGLNNCC